MKLTVKICLVLRVGPIGTLNHDPDHYRTRFIATNPMVALELENDIPLKITFFEITTIV